MHSFGMSEHYVALAEYPLVADMQAIAARQRPFIAAASSPAELSPAVVRTPSFWWHCWSKAASPRR
jgi:hypothetical protein